MSLFTCVKPSCGNQYESKEDEAYYCTQCQEARKKVMAELDAKFKNRVSVPVKTALQEYDEAPKVHGFMQIK